MYWENGSFLASFITHFTVRFLIAYMQYAKWREKAWFVYHINDVYLGRWGGPNKLEVFSCSVCPTNGVLMLIVQDEEPCTHNVVRDPSFHLSLGRHF